MWDVLPKEEGRLVQRMFRENPNTLTFLALELLAKNFSFRHWRHLGDSRFSARRGGGVERGCVTFEFPGRFGRLFIISLASKERIPKQLKQVSIVGSKINQGSCTIMYLRKILIVSNVEQSSLIMNVRPCNPNINQIR